VTLYESTQGIHSVQDEIAALFGLPKSKVRVILRIHRRRIRRQVRRGKTTAWSALHLSRKRSGRCGSFSTARGSTSRWATGHLHQRLRLGAGKDGELSRRAEGSGASAGSRPAAGCAGPVKNLYPARVARTEENDVFLHTGPRRGRPGARSSAGRVRAGAGRWNDLADSSASIPSRLRDKNDKTRRAGRSGESAQSAFG